MKKQYPAALLAAMMLCAAFPVMPASAAAVRGDADGNGSFDAADVTTLSDYLLTKTSAVSGQADLNGDGRLNAADLSLMKRMLLESTSFGDYNAIVINEVCASNQSCLQSEDGSFPDWLELYNRSDAAVSLAGFGISDGTKKPFKYTFPENTVIAGGGYLIVLCDGDGKVSAGAGEHIAPFNISAKKEETVYLTHPEDGTFTSLTIPVNMETDVTFGSTSDGAAELAYLEPTPNAPNRILNDTVYVAEPAFSREGGFYDDSFTLTLSADTQILYTLDGSDPRTSVTAQVYNTGISIYDNTNDPNIWSMMDNITLLDYYPLPDYPVDKGIVVRAAARDTDGNFSRVTSQSYFIGKTKEYYQNLKVISLTTDGDYFFDDETGIYTVGNQYYRWRESSDFDPSFEPSDVRNPTNYNSSGREWEVPAAIQVFENGAAAYAANVGVRINGNWTRAEPQKSFRIYARSEYGNPTLEYEFIDGLRDADGKKIKSFDKLLLRNGGNDFGSTKVRDALLQSLCQDRAVGVQGYEPCIVFLNGEFWGRYNIRERVDDCYVSDHYGVSKSNVTILKNYDTDGDDSLTEAFHELCGWGASADMNDPANYDRVCSEIDVQSLMDLIAIETYINNYDFAPPTYINNYQLWRVNEPDETNPYADGKWRFILCDLDMSAGLYYSSETSAEYDLLNSMNRDTALYYNFIPMFYNLLNNADFRAEFAARYTTLVQQNFDMDTAVAAVNADMALCGAAMNDTASRFGIFSDYDGDMEWFRHYFRQRPDYAMYYLKKLLAQYGGSDVTPSGNLLTDAENWGVELSGGSACDLQVISVTEVAANTTVIGENNWNPQLSYGNLTLEAGKQYCLSFTIEADEAFLSSTFIQRMGGEQEVWFWEQIQAGPTPTSYQYVFTMDRNAFDIKWGFDLGYQTGSCRIYDLSLTCLDA